MEQILSELKTVTGVIGAYIYNAREGVSAKNVPAVFKDTKLAKMGRLLIKIYSAGQMSFSNLSEASLFYEESIVTIREIGNEFYLIVLFDPSAKITMLTMAINLVMEELSQGISEKVKSDNIEPVTDQDVLPEINNEKLQPEELLNSGPMAGSLQGMQSALAKVMGPIAKIIFMDALKEWIIVDQPDFSSISNLVNILRKEINDPEKFNIYQKKITQYIWVDN